MVCWPLSVLKLPLKFKFMATWDALVLKLYCIFGTLKYPLQDWLTLPGQKQWTPPKCYISEEDSDTNSCIWVGIISVPDKFQSLLVIRPFRTYQNPISQAKLQRKLIKMEIHRRITVCCQCSMGKNCLASSPNTGISIILLYVDCPHQFILRTAGGKKKLPVTTAKMQESKHSKHA